MVRFVLTRCANLVPLLIGVTFFSFLLIKALPGDPALSLVGERASPEVIEKIRRDIGTDRPFISQYTGYLSMVARGDMGVSYFTRRDVFNDLVQKFPNTLTLAVAAMLIAVPFGTILGLISVMRQGSFLDRFASGLSNAGLSMPVFWSGLMLMLVLSYYGHLVPPSGTGGIRFLLLPALTLALPAVAAVVRITRTTALDIVAMPYIKTAAAKGLGPTRVYVVHVLRNVMIPVTTVVGLDFGSYLNGAVLTETIFAWDGIGRFTMEGIIKRDYPVVIGCIILGTIAFILVNLLVDIAYHYIDPRVRHNEKH